MLVIACLFPEEIEDAYYKDYSKIYRRAKTKPTLEQHKIDHQNKLEEILKEIF